MSISLNFELNDRDLEHFEKAMANAKEAAKDRTADDIVMCTGKLLEDAAKVHIPDFIKQRLLRLDDMIAMVRDEGWRRWCTSAIRRTSSPTVSRCSASSTTR